MNNKIIDVIKRYGEENDFYGKISEDEKHIVRRYVTKKFLEV